MWVDEDGGALWMGQDMVVSACIKDGDANIQYGEGWEEFLKSEEWKLVVSSASDKMITANASTKGKGKTKGKTKGAKGTSK